MAITAFLLILPIMKAISIITVSATATMGSGEQTKTYNKVETIDVTVH